MILCIWPHFYSLGKLKSDFYPGEVKLCPPDTYETTFPNESVSLGIVSLRFFSEWGAIIYDNSTGMPPLIGTITHYRGDLICQQMGFQQVVPGSIQTLSSYKASGFTFDACTKNSS